MSNWYNVARATLMPLTDDWPRFSALVAATSIQCRPAENLKRAIRIFRTGEITGLLPAARGEAYRALNGQPLRGPKTSEFHKALMGDETAVPVDRWMLRWAGEKRSNQTTRRRIKAKVTKLARLHRLTPRDMQAKLWCDTIRKHGKEPSNYVSP